MDSPLPNPDHEVLRLQRCINDLVSLVALPAIWSGNQPPQIAQSLIEALLRLFPLDLVYLRLNGVGPESSVETLRFSESYGPIPDTDAICNLLRAHFADGAQSLRSMVRWTIGHQSVALLPLQLGLHGDIGILVAGSLRADFPEQTEQLILRVAANQAVLALQGARRLSNQERISAELDERVSQRTRELAAINSELRMEVAERHQAEERLQTEEKELKRSESHKSAILDSALDCIVAMDHTGCITEFNRAAERTLGYRRNEIIGRHLADVIVPQSLREHHRAGLARYLATGKSKVLGQRLEMIAVRADAREIPVELTITRIPQDGPPAFTGYIRDLTERKRSEDALHMAHAQLVRSEERWRSVFENSAVGVALTELNGRFIATNPVFEKMLGYSEQELRQLTFVDITHEEYRDYNRTLISELLEGKRRQFQIEKQYRRKDGKSVWVSNNVSLVPGTERVPQFLMALSEDISERKRAEEELRASEQSLRTIVDSIPGLFSILSSRGEVEVVNPQLVEYSGRTLEELQRWGTSDTIHPDDFAHVVQVFTEAIATGVPYEFEARIRRFDGLYRWFQVRGLPLRDVDGHILRWCALHTDIDEKKHAEEALKRSEAFLAEGQHLSRTGSFSWRVKTDEISWSDELYHIFEFEPGLPITIELIGSQVHPADLPMLADMIQRMAAGVNDFEYEHRLLMPDGSVKYLHLIAHGSLDHDGRLEYIGAIQDVSQRRLSDEALGKAQSELTKVARVTSLGVLTASIAHEVNQPLSGILTNASTCLRMLSADPPNVEGALETARRTIRDGNRAADVITRLRALYNRKEPSPESMDLNEATREVTALSLSELQRNNVTLRYEFADDLPPVIGDRIQLQQVILNMIRNASDAMTAVKDRPRELLVRTERDGENRLQLSVRDTGVGFEPQGAERLFQAFYTTKHDGMGIGLSISRSIIEAHEGRLWAIANDGPGATFCFSIPTRPACFADAAIHHSQSGPAADVA